MEDPRTAEYKEKKALALERAAKKKVTWKGGKKVK